MSEIVNGRLDLYGIEHSKCNHLMTLDFKGLTQITSDIQTDIQTDRQTNRTYTRLAWQSKAKISTGQVDAGLVKIFVNYGRSCWVENSRNLFVVSWKIDPNLSMFSCSARLED